MIRNSRSAIALCVVVWLFATTSTLGAVVTFTARSQWLASFPGAPLIEDSFEDLREDFYASPLRRKGYVAVASNGLYAGKIKGNMALSTNKPDRLNLHFVAPIFGIGFKAGITDFDFKLVDGSLVYKIGNAQWVSQTTGLSFFGITSDDPFAGLIIELKNQSSSGLYPTLDNLEFITQAPPMPVPEPHSFLFLLAFGCASLHLKTRKRPG